MSVLKLVEPFEYDGVTLTEIPYDTSSIKAKTVINIINRLNKKGLSVSIPELDPNVQLELFSKVSGIPVPDLERLSPPDWASACGEMRSFLLKTSDEPETPEE